MTTTAEYEVFDFGLDTHLNETLTLTLRALCRHVHDKEALIEAVYDSLDRFIELHPEAATHAVLDRVTGTILVHLVHAFSDDLTDQEVSSVSRAILGRADDDAPD